METRKKKAPLMPALGWKDQVAYWLLMILMAALALRGIVAVVTLHDKIAFSDDRVVARAIGNGDFSASRLILVIIWFVYVFVEIFDAYAARTPIFGRKDVEYGPPKYRAVYPLLMKDKPKTAKRKKSKETSGITIIVLTLASFVMMFFSSPYSRSVILNDGSIEIYNVFNLQVYQCSADEIFQVRLDTNRRKTTRHSWGDWYPEMVIVTPDLDEYRFAVHSFRGDDVEQLQMMIKTKEFYGERCIIEGVEAIDEVVKDQYSDPQEQKLLYELFEVDLEEY